jgi:mannan endo-1,4-beta-mannosidase
MNYIKKITTLLLAILLCACCNKSSKTSQARELLQRLSTTAENGFLFGHHDDPVYGHTWYLDTNRSDVKEVCGDLPALFSFDLGRIEFAREHSNGFAAADTNLDKVPFSRIREEIIKHYERGGVITLSWHAANPITGGGSWDVGDSSVQTVLYGGVNHEKFMQWLDNIAAFVNSIKTAKGVKVPIIFRPYHENSGHWFWWGAPHCTAEQYKQLWTMTYRRIQQKGATQLLYAYSPQDITDTNNYLERYPGDDIIDILGCDQYMFNDRNEYIAKVNTDLSVITELGKTHNKVIAFTETGFEGIPDSVWWTGTLLPLIEKYPISYLVVWRNACDRPEHYYAPFKGQASANDFIKFHNDPRNIKLRQYEF